MVGSNFFFPSFYNLPETDKNIQNAQMFWASGFFPECQKFLGRKRNSTFVIFPGRLKVPQLPEMFGASWKFFLWIFSSIRIFLVPNFLSTNAIFTTYWICLKFLGSMKFHKLPECFHVFWKTFLWDSPEFPFSKKIRSFPKLPKSLS